MRASVLLPSIVGLVGLVGLAGIACADGARAAVELAPVFRDHAVVQRDRPLAVFGTAAPGEAVTVTLAGKRAAATTAADGRWTVTLEALPAGGPFELVAQGSSRSAASDVMVGEVWLCSGQSNMAMTVAGVRDAEAEAAAADLPGLRMFTVPVRAAGDAAVDVAGAWLVSGPTTAPGFSAVAYFFGREVHKALGVPVGLVVSSVGGTVAEAWTPAEAVAREPGLAPMWARAQKAVAGFDRAAAEAKWKKAWRKWREEADSDARAGRKPPPEPGLPNDPRAGLGYPGSLWNGMVAPLVGLSLRGCLWYQGESNAPRAAQYRVLLPTLVAAWRRAFGRDDLPFHVVQLAAFGRVTPSGVDSPWAELREAQALVARDVPHVGLAVTIDIGEAADIHPKNKQDVGRRLALLALARDYARPGVVCDGPSFASQRVDHGKVIVQFDHAGGGLATADGREPSGFAVASAKGEFFPARARLDGTTVVVWSPAVPHPAAVRYAWADCPDAATLVGPTGLPAVPFRTDDRPLVTAGKD
jgi:sialate O-acetylesterase